MTWTTANFLRSIFLRLKDYADHIAPTFSKGYFAGFRILIELFSKMSTSEVHVLEHALSF